MSATATMTSAKGLRREAVMVELCLLCPTWEMGDVLYRRDGKSWLGSYEQFRAFR